MLLIHVRAGSLLWTPILQTLMHSDNIFLVRLHIEPDVVLISSKADDAVVEFLDPASSANGDEGDEQRKFDAVP